MILWRCCGYNRLGEPSEARPSVLGFLRSPSLSSFTCPNVKISALLESPSVQILLFVYAKQEVRHVDLERLIGSRGTLSSNLNDLLDEGLLRRKVVASKPITSNYSLSEKGKEVTALLTELKSLVT
jgi:DNA-binding HxlR family transcriptional regulator